MKFYVNLVYDDKLKNHFPPDKNERRPDIIGLFKACDVDGRGSFGGWYGSEWYMNTELYAFYAAESSGIYNPKARISDIIICDPPIQYPEVAIGSDMWTIVIEAKTVEEAIKLFTEAKWRR